VPNKSSFLFARLLKRGHPKKLKKTLGSNLFNSRARRCAWAKGACIIHTLRTNYTTWMKGLFKWCMVMEGWIGRWKQGVEEERQESTLVLHCHNWTSVWIKKAKKLMEGLEGVEEVLEASNWRYSSVWLWTTKENKRGRSEVEVFEFRSSRSAEMTFSQENGWKGSFEAWKGDFGCV
jgi:hypothetical protein